jgi:hypothetical protein
VRSLAEPRSIGMVAGGIALVAVLVILRRWGNVLPAHPLAGLGGFLDAIVFGHTLADGNILAPLVGPLLTGAVLLRMAIQPGTSIAMGTTFDRFAVPLLQVGVAAWMVWGGGASRGTGPAHIAALSWFVAALVVATVGRLIAWAIQNRTGIDLTQGWLCCTILLALPALWSGAEPWRVVAAFGLVAALIVASGVANAVEVEVVSTRVASVRALGDAEEIAVSWRVAGRGGPGAHVFGLVIAWFIVEHLAAGHLLDRVGPWARPAATAALYYVVALAWSRAVLDRRLSPPLWRERLNSMRLVIPDATDPAVLEARLRALCTRLVWGEALALALVIAVAFSLLSDRSLPGSRLPLALLAVSGAAVFAMFLEAFARDVYKVGLARGGVGGRLVDFDLPAEPEEPQSLLDRVRQATRSRLALVLTILIVVVKLGQLLLETAKLWPSGPP